MYHTKSIRIKTIGRRTHIGNGKTEIESEETLPEGTRILLCQSLGQSPASNLNCTSNLFQILLPHLLVVHGHLDNSGFVRVSHSYNWQRKQQRGGLNKALRLVGDNMLLPRKDHPYLCAFAAQDYPIQ